MPQADFLTVTCDSLRAMKKKKNKHNNNNQELECFLLYFVADCMQDFIDHLVP